MVSWFSALRRWSANNLKALRFSICNTAITFILGRRDIIESNLCGVDPRQSNLLHTNPFFNIFDILKWSIDRFTSLSGPFAIPSYYHRSHRRVSLKASSFKQTKTGYEKLIDGILNNRIHALCPPPHYHEKKIISLSIKGGILKAALFLRRVPMAPFPKHRSTPACYNELVLCIRFFAFTRTDHQIVPSC